MLEAREPSARYLVALESPLLQQFDLIASAPKGVARLRELILTLAVQGKLVPQDPNDEPASVLLERIRVEKARLLKEKKIKKDRPPLEIAEKEKPFPIPNGWTETSFACIGNFSGGKTPSTHRPEYWGGTIPWVSSKDMKSLWISDTEDHVTQQALADGLALIPSGAVLIVVRSGILRRTVPVAITSVPCTVNQDIKAMQLALPCMAQYVQLMVRGFERFILENLTKVGTTVESIRFEDFERYPFPLPPLAEQSRIVARVEELMALCDALEAKGKLEAEQHARLVGSLFDSLANSESAHALAENWQRIATHFDLLLDRPAAVDALEQTMLQLAVRGLLVPQDPADEPASALLQKIRQEKDHLITAGKIKRDKPLAPITDEEKPFELPEGWEWARFGEVILSSDAGWSPSCESTPRDGDQWGVLKVSAVTWGEFKPEENKALPMHLQPRPEYEVQAGDFLLSRANTEELVARSVIAWHPPAKLMLSDKLIRLKLSSHVDKALYYFINNSASSRTHYIANASGTSSSMKNVSREVILTLPVPVPPAAEQSRIVARVNELRALCSTLRQCLAAVQQTQSRLADVLVESVC